MTPANTAWIFLVIAGFFEIGFAYCLKASQGFPRLEYSLGFGFCAMLSFVFLERAARILPIGISYAVWTGIGAAGIVIMGIFFFKEPTNFWQLFFLCTLILSVIGIRLVAIH